MPTDKKPNMRDLFQGMLDDHLGRQEFTDAFQKVVDLIKQLTERNQAEFSAIQETVQLLSQKLAQESSDTLASVQSETRASLQRELRAIQSSLDETVRSIDERVSQIKDGKDADEERIVQDVLAQIPAWTPPDTAEDIRNKLEVLEGDERLKIEAIRDLREELDALKKRSNQTVYVGGGGGSGGRIVKSYDLSDQLDGSTKTFALPAFWRVISVHSSSFPNAFREGVDWTSDGAAMTITFTAEISADTTLAQGQTIIVVYAEA